MGRAKARARRGPEGHAYRENTKTEEGRKLNKENKKRKREATNAAKAAKKAKNNHLPSLPEASNGNTDNASLIEEAIDESAQQEAGGSSMVETSNNTLATASISPPLVSHLAKAHEVATMSIISSSHIQQKVKRALDILSVYPAIPFAKPPVVLLHSKAKVAAKMISIVEIIKREIAQRGGKWYQYNNVSQVMEDRKQKDSTKKNEMGKSKDAELDEVMGDPGEDGIVESDEEAFETMKTPFERAIEGKPKMRAVPIMTIYLSRIRIESLRREFE